VKPFGTDLARRKLRVAAPVTRKLAIVATVCLAAAAALLAGPGARAAVVLPAPAITVADGNSVIATATDTFGLNFYWNQYGTDTWHTEQVTTSQKIAESAPSVAQVGNDVVIAARGADNSLWVFWQVNGTSGWNPVLVNGPNTTFSAPVIAADGSAAIMTAAGPGNSLDFYWAPGSPAGWLGQTAATASTTYSDPAMTVNDGSVNIAVEGPNNSLDFYWAQNGTWATQGPAAWVGEVVAGAGSDGNDPAIAPTGSAVDIVVGAPNSLMPNFYWAYNGTTQWVPGRVPEFDRAASAVVPYPGALHVVNVDSFGALQSLSDANGTGVWTSTDITGFNTEQSVPAVTMNGSSENIAVFDSLGNLDFYWADGGGTFHGETVDASGDAL